MSSKAEQDGSQFDTLKWIAVSAIVAAGIAGNLIFIDQSLLYRVVGLLLLAVAAVAIAFQTQKGADFWELLKGSRTEIRKVVWPSHPETMQTTFIVLAVVVVMALLLWGLDSLLSLLVAKIIG